MDNSRQIAGVALAAAMLTSALPASASRAGLRAGRALVERWRGNDLAGVHATSTPEFQAKFPLERFLSLFPKDPGRLIEDRARSTAGAELYEAQLLVPSMIAALRVSWTPDWRVAGLTMNAADGRHAYPSSHASQSLPQRIRLPFDAGSGPWTVLGKHHRAARSQRFAYDLYIERGGDSRAGPEDDVRSYHCYGQPVLAPVDGEVVSVVDSEPDSTPPAPGATTPGNSVLIKAADDLYLFLAHLQPGSVSVKAGERVAAGQPVGRVGNSGHSTQPHLHVEAFDSLPRETADAWPLHFDEVLVNGRRKARALPDYGDKLQAPSHGQ